MLTLTTGELQPSVDALHQMVKHSHWEGFPVAIHAVEQEAVAAAVQVLRENPPILARYRRTFQGPHRALRRVSSRAGV